MIPMKAVFVLLCIEGFLGPRCGEIDKKAVKKNLAIWEA
jgi:hypothetical protein